MNKHSKNIKSFFVSFLLGSILMFVYIVFTVFIGLPNIESLLLSVLVYGAFLEEGLKFLISLLLIKRFKVSFFSVAFVALGFGFVEQLAHIFGGDSLIVWTIGMHFIAGVVSSIYFSKKRTSMALIAPIIVHGLYNLLIWLYIVLY